MHDRVFIWGLAGLFALFVVAFHSAEVTSLQQQRTAAETIHKRLLDIDSTAQTRKVTMGLIREIFPLLRGRDARDAAIPGILAHGLRGIASGSVEVYLTDIEENLLWSSQPGSGNFPAFKARLGSGDLHALGLRTPIWRVHRLRTMPYLQAVWRIDRTVAKPRIAGALFLVDTRALNSEALVHFLLGRWEERGARYGYWNRVTGARSHLPQEVAASDVPRLFRTFSRQNGHSVAVKDDRLVMVPVAGPAVLMGLARKPGLRFPLWWHAALCTFLVLGVLRPRSQRPNTISLKLFVSLSLMVAAGIPLLSTLMFWSLFEENRARSLEKEQFTRLEQHLINIDRKLPEEIRRRARILKDFSHTLEQSLDNLEPHIRKLNLMEIENQLFDSGFFISSQGVHLRGFGFQETSLRQIARFPVEERRERIQEFLESGLFTPTKWLQVALDMDMNPDSVRRLWDCTITPQHQAKMEAGIAVLGKVILQRFNQQAKKNDDTPEGGGKQDMVYGAMIDSQTGDMIQMALANFQRAIALGTGEISSFVYADVLKDAMGRGQYFLLDFMDLRGIQGHFLNDIFQAPETWPADISFAAESWFCYTNYPRKNRPAVFRSYLGKLLPRKRMLSETTWVGGKKVLLSAFAARNLKHFILFATSPYSVIEKKEKELRREMLVISLMMALLVLGISRQLYRSIIAPAERLLDGIRAMEEKNYEHRIPLMTGDEWDEIAESFNQTIGSLEELEVAKVVQSQILPQEVVSVAGAGFLGRSLMTGQVGGDYFDAIANDDGSLNFVIGDVTGHGVSAALVVAMAKSAFHFIHRRGVRSPAEMLKQMNAMIIKSLSKKKALSMQIGLYKPDGRLVFANAGHPYPFLLVAGKDVKPLVARGMVLGVAAKPRFEEVVLELDSAGGTLVLFTDGIIEQMNFSGGRYGLEGFQNTLKSLTTLAPDHLIREVQEAVFRFAAGRPLEDDVTVALFSWNGRGKG